jgi:single-strand selective monofunctional uracil DNA glycosylase
MTSSAIQPVAKRVIVAARLLRRDLSQLHFTEAAAWVYNPLEYAWRAHEQYLTRYARASCEVLFLGMNPGPWGMAQTGVPFGEIAAVTGFLDIRTRIDKPSPEHPKRPIQGFECPRSEVSGKRLWGLFQQKFSTAEAFFELHFVGNYCPLIFMEESARNITPDKLTKALRDPLEAVCDQHLATLIELLSPRWVIGVGAFAEKCAARVRADFESLDFQIGRILHPSPASPAANQDWAGTATRQLEQLGVW